MKRKEFLITVGVACMGFITSPVKALSNNGKIDGYAGEKILVVAEEIFKKHGICFTPQLRINYKLYIQNSNDIGYIRKSNEPLYAVSFGLPPTYHEKFDGVIRIVFNSIARDWVLAVKEKHSLGDPIIFEIATNKYKDRKFPNMVTVYWVYRGNTDEKG